MKVLQRMGRGWLLGCEAFVSQESSREPERVCEMGKGGAAAVGPRSCSSALFQDTP